MHSDTEKIQKDINKILRIKDNHIFMTDLMDYVYDHFNPNGVKDYYTELPEIAKIIVAVYSYDMEVSSGGFFQYLINSSGDNSSQLLEFLKKINALKNFELVKHVSKYFPEGTIPHDRTVRMKYIGRLKENDEFTYFRAESRECEIGEEDVRINLRNYISANKGELIDAMIKNPPVVDQSIIDRQIANLENANEELDRILEEQSTQQEMEFMSEIKGMVRSGDTLAAIKLYKQKKGCGMKEAKEAVMKLTRN